MITAGSYPPVSIDLGKDEPGMTLQYRDIERGYIVWRDYRVDGEVVNSPVESDVLIGIRSDKQCRISLNPLIL